MKIESPYPLVQLSQLSSLLPYGIYFFVFRSEKTNLSLEQFN